MRYPCLVLDHDDTVVASTASIHYPSFLAYLEQVRPGTSYSCEEYYAKNFEPGVTEFFTDELGFTPQEMEEEYRFWQEYVRTRVPKVYDGIREILLRHRARGGRIVVVSHSVSSVILRDYRENGLPEPDAVFGWDDPAPLRKPNPYPLEETMRRFGYRPQELLMLDDLKPGFEMCRKCGVDFAAALWGFDAPPIAEFMRKNADFCFARVSDFGAFLEEANG